MLVKMIQFWFLMAFAVIGIGLDTSAATSPKAMKSLLDGAPSMEPVVRVENSAQGKTLTAVSTKDVEVDILPILAPAQSPGQWSNRLEVHEADYLAEFGEWLPKAEGISWKSLAVGGDWNVLQQIVHCKTVDGNDGISLSMLTLESTSATGALSDTFSVGRHGYSTAAIGFKADGTVVKSGSPDIMVSRIIVVFQMSLFSGGATQSGLDEIRRWVFDCRPGKVPESWITYKLSMTGAKVIGGEAEVKILQPYLTIVPGFVTFQGDEPGYAWNILEAPAIVGPWKLFAVAKSGNRFQISGTSPRFFRATSGP